MKKVLLEYSHAHLFILFQFINCYVTTVKYSGIKQPSFYHLTNSVNREFRWQTARMVFFYSMMSGISAAKTQNSWNHLEDSSLHSAWPFDRDDWAWQRAPLKCPHKASQHSSLRVVRLLTWQLQGSQHKCSNEQGRSCTVCYNLASEVTYSALLVEAVTSTPRFNSKET